MAHPRRAARLCVKQGPYVLDSKRLSPVCPGLSELSHPTVLAGSCPKVACPNIREYVQS